MNNLDYNRFEVKSGNETLKFKNRKLNHKLIEFWRWSSSDLLSNSLRGKFAEYIIAIAMDLNLNYSRDEWSAYDLEALIEIEEEKYISIKIEVKSSSYIQTWVQNGFSKIIFSIKKKGVTNIKSKEEKLNRPSDVYVFCLLNHYDKNTANPLNLDQWLFYIVSTKKINKIFDNKVSISLNSLEKITTGVKFNEIKNRIINEYLEE